MARQFLQPVCVYHQMAKCDFQGDYVEVRRLFGQSLTICERLGDQRGQATTLHQLGNNAYLQGDYVEARRLYEQSLAIKEQLGDQDGRAMTLYGLGIIAQQQGNYVEARRLYEQGLTIFERLGDQNGQATTWHQLGLLACEEGDFEHALTYVMRAYILFDSLHSPSRDTALRVIAWIRGHVDEASFMARWRTIAGNRPLPMLPAGDANQRLGQVVIEFVQAPTWHESKRFLESHLELLQPEVDAVLQALAAQQKHDGIRKAIEEHRLLLARCRDEGIVAAFAAYQGAKDPAMAFVAELNRLCHEVISMLRAGDGEQQEALATRLEQMRENGLPMEGALDFLQLLVAWLRKQEIQMLKEKLQAPFHDTYAQMVAAVDQEDTEDTQGNDGLTVEGLPRVVASLVLQGTTEQRRQIATQMVEAQRELPPEEAALGRFWGCLAAALLGGAPEIASLEAPFTDLWQEFQDALKAAPGEDRERGESSHG